MFSRDRFVQDCIEAVKDGQPAIRELVQAAVSTPNQLVTELGEPKQAGISPLYRDSDITIIHFAWAPHMTLMPHNHQMFAVIGIYSGREDNIFWKRNDAGIEAAGAKSMGVGEVATLGRNIIHSVANPIGKMTTAIHVYGGDFFEPGEPRSEWDYETLTEHPWEVEKIKAQFNEAEERFNLYANARHSS